MGGCASKPKDLDLDRAPAPVEAPAPAPEAETAAQEKKDGGEAKEGQLVDVSEPAPEGPNIEEVMKMEAKPAAGEAVPVETMPVEAKAEAVEANGPPKEAKKEVTELP
ncbi:hypothetical protein Salat_0780400 [Sesamum alatum]|uniref:Uncharacterized protein n=1 Tax=Sesamum alatum TaxID=300844 RepID=A0AAE1YU08_9LAMI|nr:hypothetical protein Salat_0780400 [Sesamum alatum]